MTSDRVLPDLHEDDAEHVAELRRLLAGWRVTSLLKQKDITAKAGLGDTVVSCLERGETGPMRLANVCRYASVFGLAVKVSFPGIPEPVFTPELESLQTLSEANPFSPVWLETLIVKYLREARKQQGLTLKEVAAQLNMRLDTLSRWELEGTDPHIYRMMAYARVLGGRMRMGLELVP